MKHSTRGCLMVNAALGFASCCINHSTLPLCCKILSIIACPQEAPQSYIDDPVCKSIPYSNRLVLCAMLRAAD